MVEIIVLVLILVLDQASKIICASWLTTLPLHSYTLIDGVLSLTYVQNSGASFGMMQGARVFFLITTGIACILIIAFLLKEHVNMHTLMRISVSLILSGAIGNFIDRAALGYVRDMIHVRFVDFPVFNIADSAVCAGAFLLLLDVFFFKKGRKYLERFDKKKKTAQDQEKPE